jgi:2-polyprenyl-3-methyl-5-hydroxy-6-metoxy-1,4-benzoquinol methylase
MQQRDRDIGKDIGTTMTDSQLTREYIYRDTKTFYSEAEHSISIEHLDFCKQYAGPKILDFGCATGNYCLELARSGYTCVGVDVNENYVNIARKKGLEATVIKETLPFTDKAFDTVTMIEVLEHVRDTDKVLQEVRRVARQNILITVPNCSNFNDLQNMGLTYAHFLELDHVNFFTKASLSEVLKKHFDNFVIFERGPVYPYRLLPRSFLYYSVGLLYMLRLVKPKLFTQLFAIVTQ